MSKQAPHLVVGRPAIREALRSLSAATQDSGGGMGDGDVRIAFRDGEMTLSQADGRVSVAADGCWPGEARCPLPSLLALMDGEPMTGGTLHMEYRAARLHVGGGSLAAPWRDVGLPPVSVPRDTALPYLPQLRNEAAAGAARRRRGDGAPGIRHPHPGTPRHHAKGSGALGRRQQGARDGGARLEIGSPGEAVPPEGSTDARVLVVHRNHVAIGRLRRWASSYS